MSDAAGELRAFLRAEPDAPEAAGVRRHLSRLEETLAAAQTRFGGFP
jgi:hypothetical protein